MNAHDTSHASYEPLAAGYALSALEPEDEQVFLAHLAGCAACERALVEHREALAQLAYSVAAEPPSAVLEGIRAGVAQSGRAGAFPAPLTLDSARRRRARSMRLMTAVASAAAAIVVLAGGLLFVNNGLPSQQDDTQQAAARLDAAVSSLLEPGARKVDLSGEGGARGAVVVDGRDVSLVVSGVPVNDTGSSVYVLWGKSRAGAVRAVGTFDVDSQELDVIRDLRLPDTADPVAAFIVTRESGRVAPARTTQPAVVAGEA